MSLPDILEAKFNGVDILDGPTFYEMVTGKLLIEDTNPSWFIFSSGFKTTPFKRLTKSALDRLLAGMGLLITMPLFPVIALLIKYNSPGPIFFKQSRVGEGERNFFMYKFRTMYQDAESLTGAVWAQENDPRITGIGRILRKTRLDEIPQLYNVLKGEMSLVGPRPERPEFVRKLKEIIPYYSQRHFSKPGITGWAQIRYPYGASVEDAIEKLRFDLYYIKHMSLIFDLLILLETAKVALLGRGAR
jgi:sugar transferase (PEP-CTERM system associated)